MIETIFILLVAFQIKHLIADYYLQFPYMYENKGKPSNWFAPLYHHALVHAIGTFIIVASVVEESSLILVVAFMLDLITHFAIDRWEATQKGGPDTSGFWTNLGINQMLHHLVGIYIIYLILPHI